MIVSFPRFLVILASSMCVCLPALSQKVAADDPLAEFLHSRGFANIPYIKQNQAKLGGVVADPFSPGIATFEVPTKAVPSSEPNPGILIPSEIVAQIQSAGLGLKLLGFDSAADFQHPESLTYSTINLTGPQLNIDQVRELLGDPATVQKLNHYKGELTKVKKNQKFTADLYIASGIFYTTGVDIVAKSGTVVSLQSNKDVPACAAIPAAGSPKGGDSQDPKKQNAPISPVSSTDAPTQDKVPVNPQPSTSTTKIVDAAPKTPVQEVTNAAKGASDAAAKAVNTVSSVVDKGIPGGQGHYCRGVNGEVHFSSDRPIPVAMEVYSAVWNGTGYEPLSPKTTPIFKVN